MSRLSIGALVLCLVALFSGSPALAVFNQDPSTGGNPGACPPADKCCICKATAIQNYNKCIKDSCSGKVGPARALCFKQCADVKDQDILKCTIDNLCA